MSALLFLILRILITVSLYIFIGWILLTLWQDIHQKSTQLSERKVPPLAVKVQSPNNPIETRHYIKPIVMIGRDPACDCVLFDDSVSIHHARLNYHHNQWWLEDLGSTNRTLINGSVVETATVVITGDVISCGKSLLSISLMQQNTIPLQIPDQH